VRSLYRLAVALAAPLHAASLALRGRTAPGRRVAERFGFGARIDAAPLWIHAASVGEVQLAATVVHALRERYPSLPILITAFTATGAARAGDLGSDVSVRYLPYDLPGSVRRFLDRTRPRLAIILETELWPTLYRACRERDIGLVIANARLSSRSARRYRRFAALFRAALCGVHVAAQSAADAARFRALGAAPDRTEVIGNLKFDLTLPPDIAVRGRGLRERYAPARPMWVAGSTHAGEDEWVIAAHRRIRERLPTALLALAPRHPQRFAAVAARLAAQNIPFVRHSRAADHQRAGDAAVVLLDTLGELLDFYAAADVAFVGGSLVPVGGHNLLEPAALGRAVATGPYVFNAAQVADVLIECGGARMVRDGESLAACIGAWLQDAPERARVGGLGRAALEANRGALERLMALIEPLLAHAASPCPHLPEG
jgi:3-deoxy-D-manno-octulosonic-acid transferase